MRTRLLKSCTFSLITYYILRMLVALKDNKYNFFESIRELHFENVELLQLFPSNTN